MKGGAIKKTLNSLVHNKIVLYVLLALSLDNLITYLEQRNICALNLNFAKGLGSTL